MDSNRAAPRRTPVRRALRGCALGCAGVFLLIVISIVLLVALVSKVPKSYPLASQPIPPAIDGTNADGGLDGFASPYLGHTGSWDGKGGALAGGSKLPDLDREQAMGLRWTFMPVYWRALEREGPVDLSRDTPPAWKQLDAFIIAANARNLNVLMQAPVVGGNAGGPPSWAGRREKGKSAPADMDALVAFAGKLAGRYRPGGTLAKQQGWGEAYGVRAWELDNEPETYLTHWQGQAGDYAEFATRTAARIRAADPHAVIVLPGLASGKPALAWLELALDAPAMNGSPAFRARRRGFSIGPAADVVSFHTYEGLAFSGEPLTIVEVFEGVRAVVEKWEQRSPGFTYARKQDYWHTEGNFDFLGILSSERRAAWRFQFFTRAFAAGIRKVAVMDPSAAEQTAVRAYIGALPNPFPMLPALNEVVVRQGRASVFRHPDGSGPNAGHVWVAWAVAGTGPARVEIPAQRKQVKLIFVDGHSTLLTVNAGRVTLDLKGDSKMPPPVILVDPPNGPQD